MMRTQCHRQEVYEKLDYVPMPAPTRVAGKGTAQGAANLTRKKGVNPLHMHMALSGMEQRGELFDRGMEVNNVDLSRLAACEKGVANAQVHKQLKRELTSVEDGACDARSAKAM
jgi:hypothetical protein